ncbi:MAG: TonB-dependent receptor [Bacteroidales bacterium]|nr:TonB-dependent receptor [Bacteroidales bacterium]
MLQTTILTALVLSTPIVVMAENGMENHVVQGVVIDEMGHPLPAAAVRVLGTTQSTGTSSKGEFRLSLSKAGRRTLLVSYVGYTSQHVEIEVGAQNSPLRIQLHPTLGTLGEAVVTGSRMERQLKDAPVITRVIGRAEIERINPLDMNGLLQYTLPGIQFRFNTMSQTATMTYQGMNSKMVVFLIDGERISGESSDHNIDYNRLNIDDIERIEVVRGAASTLYDSNAQGGVINIITRRASRPISLTLNGRYSEQHGQRYGLNLGTKHGAWETFTTLGHRRRPTFYLTDNAAYTYDKIDEQGKVVAHESEASTLQVPYYGYTAWDASQRVGYTFSDQLSAEVKGTYYNNVRATRPSHRHHERYEDWTLSGRIKYLPHDGHQIDLSHLSDNYLKRHVYHALDLIETPYINRQNTTRLNYTGTLGMHHVSVGAEWLMEDLRHYMMPQGGSRSGHRLSLYAQEDWRIAPQVQLVGGVRLDKAEGYAAHLTPKLSLLYRPQHWLTLRTNFSHGYRPPTLKERFQEFNMMNIMYILGNENLRPEKSQQISASLEFEKGGCNFTASVFHNRYKDYIDYAYARVDALQYINTDDRRTTGLELSTRYRNAAGFMLMLTYNYVNDYNLHHGYNISSTRPHAFTFGASHKQKIGKQWVANAAFNGHWGARFTSHQYLPKEKAYARYVYDARLLCSLNLSASLPKYGLTAGVMIDNIFNHRDRATTATVQLPDQGRTLVFTLGMNVAELFAW